MKLGGWRPQGLLEWPPAYRLAMWAFGAAAARRELLGWPHLILGPAVARAIAADR